jgi:hypothetical protein
MLSCKTTDINVNFSLEITSHFPLINSCDYIMLTRMAQHTHVNSFCPDSNPMRWELLWSPFCMLELEYCHCGSRVLFLAQPMAFLGQSVGCVTSQHNSPRYTTSLILGLLWRWLVQVTKVPNQLSLNKGGCSSSLGELVQSIDRP